MRDVRRYRGFMRINGAQVVIPFRRIHPKPSPLPLTRKRSAKFAFWLYPIRTPRISAAFHSRNSSKDAQSAIRTYHTHTHTLA